MLAAQLHDPAAGSGGGGSVASALALPVERAAESRDIQAQRLTISSGAALARPALDYVNRLHATIQKASFVQAAAHALRAQAACQLRTRASVLRRVSGPSVARLVLCHSFGGNATDVGDGNSGGAHRNRRLPAQALERAAAALQQLPPIRACAARAEGRRAPSDQPARKGQLANARSRCCQPGSASRTSRPLPPSPAAT